MESAGSAEVKSAGSTEWRARKYRVQSAGSGGWKAREVRRAERSRYGVESAGSTVRRGGRSDVERVFDDPERHRVRADAVDGDDVEAAGIFQAAGPGQVVEGHRGDPALLRTRHGFGRVAAPRRPPRLHFHEDQGPPVLGDDVNFSKARAEPGGKNCVPAFRQRLAGEQFALFSERLAIGGFRHELARSKGRAGRGRLGARH